MTRLKQYLEDEEPRMPEGRMTSMPTVCRWDITRREQLGRLTCDEPAGVAAPRSGPLVRARAMSPSVRFPDVEA